MPWPNAWHNPTAIQAELSRRNLLDFVVGSIPQYQTGWIHHQLCHELMQFAAQVQQGHAPRLLICMPPRHGKSCIVSERFPAWLLGHYPQWQVMVATYGQSLSNRFSRRARDLLNEPWYQKAFPHTRLSGSRAAVAEWETTQGGCYKAVGVGGALTGSGAHVLVIDDPIKGVADAYSKKSRDALYDWYRSVAQTRLMPQGGIVLTMTRWHHDDLAGRLLATNSSDAFQGWRVLSFPAIAEQPDAMREPGEALCPELFPLARLEQIKRESGWVWEALYQQRPNPEQGTVFKREWWQQVEAFPVMDEVIHSWDMTFTDSDRSDYVVGMVLGRKGQNYYVMDVVRERLDFTGTLRAVERLRQKHPTSRIYIEATANGHAVITALKQHIHGIIPVTPRGSKEARAAAVTPTIEAGHVFLPSAAPWVNTFLEEATCFPKATHDDQVDAFTQGLHVWTQGRGFFFVSGV